MGATVFAVEKLKIESNPFDAGLGGRVGRPLQKALGEVIRQIGLEAPVVVVSGSPGTGKTLLAKMAKRACADMGLSVRRIDRGDFADLAGGQRSDVLLVDEADSLPDSTSHLLLFEGDKRPATTTVLLCLPASIRRFSTVADAVFVELTRLSQSDTRLYLQERATQAGLPDLFAPAALDLLIDASRGVPRTLWSIAGLAYFSAACAGASQISRQNVADAAASQTMRPEIPEAAVPTAPSVKLVTETPARTPAPLPVANPPRTSESVAVFPSGTNLNLGLSKRINSAISSAEAPTLQMPRTEPQEALDRSTSAAITPAIATTNKRPEWLAEPPSELPQSIAAALDPAAATRGELPIDHRKARDVLPAQTAHSETIVARGRDDLFVFADAPAPRMPDRPRVVEPISEMPSVPMSSAPLSKPVPETPVARRLDTLPVARPRETRAEPAMRAQVIQRAAEPQIESFESAQAASIAQRFAPAGTQREAARRPLVTVGNAAAVALALAAGVALTIYVQPMFLNEEAAVAPSARTIAVIAPAVADQPSVTPVNPPPLADTPAPATQRGRAAGQAAGTGSAARNGAARRAATTRATQRANETRASAALNLGSSAATAVATPVEDTARNEATIQAEAARAATEADAIAAAVVAAQQRAERERMVKESVVQAQTAAIRDADTANRLEAAAQAARAAQDKADREAQRQRRLLDATGGFHLHTGQ